MIPRYSRPEMVDIWSPSTKFKIWYEIEAHACDAMAKIGIIPAENAEAVWKAKDVEFDVSRICLLYTSPSPRDISGSRMPSSA